MQTPLFRLERNGVEKAECTQVFISEDRMKMTNQQLIPNTKILLTPHHAILKPSSLSTKVRAMFAPLARLVSATR